MPSLYRTTNLTTEINSTTCCLVIFGLAQWLALQLTTILSSATCTMLDQVEHTRYISPNPALHSITSTSSRRSIMWSIRRFLRHIYIYDMENGFLSPQKYMLNGVCINKLIKTDLILYGTTTTTTKNGSKQYYQKQ